MRREGREYMSETLGLGVLGLGEGRSIISAGVQSAAWNVVCLCDTNTALAQERCAEFGLTRYTTDYDAMLADPAVDVVGIYTPDHLHADHIIRALDAGKHVICTKPFIDDLSRARDVLAAQQRSGRQVMVGQSTRFFAPFIRQREHYESGALGDLVTIEASYSADHRWFLGKPWARQPAFKWLYGGISHPADLVRWYLPDVSEVMGYAYLSANGRAGGLANPDTSHFVLKAVSGKIARVTGVYSCPTVPAERNSPMTCILRCDRGASQALGRGHRGPAPAAGVDAARNACRPRPPDGFPRQRTAARAGLTPHPGTAGRPGAPRSSRTGDRGVGIAALPHNRARSARE